MVAWRIRVALIAVLAACAGVSVAGCGGTDDGKTIKVDEAKEKALTDSMRGYYEKGAGKAQ